MTAFHKAHSEHGPTLKLGLKLATSNSAPVYKSISIKVISERQRSSPSPCKRISTEDVAINCGDHLLLNGIEKKGLAVFRPKQKVAGKGCGKCLHAHFQSLAKLQQNFIFLLKQLLLIFHAIAGGLDASRSATVNKFQTFWTTTVEHMLEILSKTPLVKKVSSSEGDNGAKPVALIRGRKGSIGSLAAGKAVKPQEPKPLTLVLDLDETLVHSTRTKPCKEHESVLVAQNDGTYAQVYVKRRPNLNLFLKKISEEYNVVIFTASQMKYADAVLNLIDEGAQITQRLYRQSCERINNKWVKDLTKLGTDLSRTIFIDNEVAAGSLQPDNHFHIQSWFDCEEDKELLKYMELLLDYAREWKTETSNSLQKDVREFISKTKKELMTMISDIKEHSN